MDALAQALGVQKGSLYSLTGSKQQLLFDTMSAGARAFHAALDAIPEDEPAIERVRAALRGHLRVVAERRRYEERWRALFREGVESGDLRTDLDSGAATLLVLSAANWAYTWLEPGRDTDELADRFLAILVDGIRGYATPA
jgi:AcrR family transcriptional regulator